ncbi:MAG: hypothetical protein RMK57_04785 [Bryobacterales bacterium]|nr:hypothetical protein [Bryobacteraceae bacterium]MDW8353828.1 hypothetical protein [Bryobacterales bacterium]
MPKHLKPGFAEALDCGQAAVHFKDAPAAVTLEVVVMVFPGSLIQDCSARQVYSHQAPVFHHRLQVAIVRGNPQPPDLTLSRAEDLTWGERPVDLVEQTTDGGPLTGIALRRS